MRKQRNYGNNSIHHYNAKNETRTLSNTIHKNKLKMDLRSKHKTRNYKTPRGEHRQNTF